MSARDQSITSGSRSIKFVRPSQLRKLRPPEQVAAVCYRIGARGIEFLLVQTRKGRWTFPKGGVEPRLTHAQTAALEAFEEAGVHGRMEEEPFARYLRRSGGVEVVVHAHLCEVLQVSPPQESGRNPTWFSPEKAKRRLRESRRPDDCAEFARVVDRAVARAQRLHNPACPAGDALQKVGLEALPKPEIHGRVEAALFAYIRRRGGVRRSAAVEPAPNAQRCKVLQLGLPLDGYRRLLEERTPDDDADRAPVAETKALGTGRRNRRS